MDPKNILRLARTRQRFEKYMILALQEAGYPDMAPAHGALASTLKSQGSLTMSDLALWVEKRKPTVTVLVNKMQKYKLVKCEKDKGDQRITRVCLTEAGEAFANTTNVLANQLLNQVVENIPQEKQEIFTEVLGTMLENLEEYR